MVRTTGCINIGYLARHYRITRERVRRILARKGFTEWRVNKPARRPDATIATRNAAIAVLIRSAGNEDDAIAPFGLARATLRTTLCALGASARTIRTERETAREARIAAHRRLAPTAPRRELATA